MKPWVMIEKKVGETPLEALSAWKRANLEYANVPASYAGRLDPMASGKLLILLGEECKKQDLYTGLDKEYEIEVVFDLATDTGDVLGLPSYLGIETQANEEDIASVIRTVSGAHTLPYPAFSSKTVAGKPLFLYMLEGTLDTIDIPMHEETIQSIELLEHSETPRDTLAARIDTLMPLAPRSDEPSKVLGADFRQDEIRAAWKDLFGSMPKRSFSILRLRVSCGSGTYMRTLAGRIGRELGTTAFAISIHRTRIQGI